MESASGLEGTNSLVVLAFEEEMYPRVRWSLFFVRRADKCFW